MKDRILTPNAGPQGDFKPVTGVVVPLFEENAPEASPDPYDGVQNIPDTLLFATLKRMRDEQIEAQFLGFQSVSETKEFDYSAHTITAGRWFDELIERRAAESPNLPLPTLTQIQIFYINHVFKLTGGKMHETSKILGVDKSTFFRWRKCIELGTFKHPYVRKGKE